MIADGVVYAANGSGSAEGGPGPGALVALDLATGTERSRFALGSVAASPAVVGGVVSVADLAVLYALD